MNDKPPKNNLLHSLCYYTLDKEAYLKCMDAVFPSNIKRLKYLNLIIFISLLCFSLFPALIDKNFSKAEHYYITAFIALSLYICAGRLYRQKKTLDKRIIYLLISLYYANLMLFGIYLGVLANRGGVATNLMSFMIVALLLFTLSPAFVLISSSCAFIAFIISTVLYKDTSLWILDIQNALAAYLISLAANWSMARYKLLAVLHSMELKKERDNWFSQSTVDVLSQLNNRRAFTQTFQRYLSNHRDTDKWLNLAIIDIDCFKEYNDYYGHPKGDSLIHTIGGVLNDLQASRGIFTARIGGDEFALLWLANEKSSVDNIIVHLQTKIQELQISHIKSNICESLTVSIGAYVARLDSPNTLDVSNTMETVYSFADKALYEAKRGGKNRAIIRRDEIKQGQTMRTYVHINN